jgi:hypothetical protein
MQAEGKYGKSQNALTSSNIFPVRALNVISTLAEARFKELHVL